MKPFGLVCFVWFIACISSAKAQKTFHVTIQKPALITNQSISITYDDGTQTQTVADSFVNNRVSFSGKFYSRYAVLNISHLGSDSQLHYDRYFVDNRPAQIIFSTNASLQTEGHFEHKKLTNAIEIYQSKIKKQRDAFIIAQHHDLTHFLDINGDSVFRKDSLVRIFCKKIKEINTKDIEFIKKNKNEYFSFWFFRTQVVQNALVDQNTTVLYFKNLLNVYNTVFPSAFKNTAEGRSMKDELLGRINTTVGRAAPSFEIKDIEGRKLRLADLKGRKYALVDFWATWCAPCMKEIPFIKQIRANYSESQLAIISVSTDTDNKHFRDVIKEKGMDWVHVYGDKKLPLKFGITAYPTLFLIDKNGMVVYDGKGKGQDDLVALLKEMH